jgi:hypothetical protein
MIRYPARRRDRAALSAAVLAALSYQAARIKQPLLLLTTNLYRPETSLPAIRPLQEPPPAGADERIMVSFLFSSKPKTALPTR